MLTGSQYVDSKNPQKLEVYNPKDASLVASDVALAGEHDVDAAIAAAEAAFPAWKKTRASERRTCLLKLATLIEQHASTLAELTRITVCTPTRLECICAFSSDFQ